MVLWRFESESNQLIFRAEGTICTTGRVAPRAGSSDWESLLTAIGLRKESCSSHGGERVTCWRAQNDQEAFTLFTSGACSSSMDLAWQITADDLFPTWASVLVTAQTSGRGQFRRLWHSPPGNVYGSLRLPVLNPTWRNLTPLLLGAGVLGVLQDLNLPARIKWPNDLLVGSKKVGGILVEERHGIVIAGVGLNLESAPAPDRVRNRHALPAGCLADFGVNMSAPEMWIQLVRNLRSGIEATTAMPSKEAFIKNLETHLAYVGETVILNAGNGENRTATLVGLDSCGGIKVTTSEGEQVFCSGSIHPLSWM